jgi:hypothetical protein
MKNEGWVWWFMSIISATWEVHIKRIVLKLARPHFSKNAGCGASICHSSYTEGLQRRTAVRGWPGQKLSETHMSMNKLGIVACACHPSYVWGIKRKIMVQAGTGRM